MVQICIQMLQIRFKRFEFAFEFFESPSFSLSFLQTTGDAKRFNTANDDNFSQVGTFWRKVLSEEEKTRLVQNIAGHLKDATEFIQHRAVSAYMLIKLVRDSLFKAICTDAILSAISLVPRL